MANPKPAPRRGAGGKSTPSAKNTKSARTTKSAKAPKPATPAGTSGRATPKSTGRYTPPVPRSVKVSPLWVPIVMFTALGLGMAMLILNYVDILPGGTSNGYLLGGLALITVGFVTATRLH